MQKCSSKIKFVFILNLLKWSVFDVALLEERDGIAILLIKGKKLKERLKYEPGGHRIQRIPPNEKRGRVHTSTVTVAVMDIPKNVDAILNPKDLEFQTTKSSGSGGQHLQKTETCVIVKHKPTGLMVRCQNERSQDQNKKFAVALLLDKIQQIQKVKQNQERFQIRKEQVGSGMRGDKVRTIRYQDDIVTNEITGSKISLKKYLKGDWSGLI